MAKHTAIRLENSLMLAAKNAAVIHKRTPVEQIEYWAELGRNISKFVDTESLIACGAGLAEIKVEKIDTKAIDPSLVFNNLELQRNAGALSKSVTKSTYRYQASDSCPGMLERIDQDGEIKVGSFKNGIFEELKETFN